MVYSGAVEIAANQGHIQHKLGSGGAFSKGIMYRKWPKCSIMYIDNQNNNMTYTYKMPIAQGYKVIGQE